VATPVLALVVAALSPSTYLRLLANVERKAWQLQAVSATGCSTLLTCSDDLLVPDLFMPLRIAVRSTDGGIDVDLTNYGGKVLHASLDQAVLSGGRTQSRQSAQTLAIGVVTVDNVVKLRGLEVQSGTLAAPTSNSSRAAPVAPVVPPPAPLVPPRATTRPGDAVHLRVSSNGSSSVRGRHRPVAVTQPVGWRATCLQVEGSRQPPPAHTAKVSGRRLSTGISSAVVLPGGAAVTSGERRSKAVPFITPRSLQGTTAPSAASTITSLSSSTSVTASGSLAMSSATSRASIGPAPPSHLNADPALRQCIERDMLVSAPAVTFDDIAALDDAKRVLTEAVVMPMLMPEMFVGIRQPWRGVLLFGPPGSGKTMLAKAVAGVTGTTFFNVSAATLTSKWRGESEKLVRCLFDMARHHAPSVIFIDEVDCLGTTRGADTEHEASRRVKTELLTQMDGLQSSNGGGGGSGGSGSSSSSNNSNGNSSVVVIAACNTPWDLDDALRRRLEKRVHVPLPDTAARLMMLQMYLKELTRDGDVDYPALAAATDGYSGADIKVVCREASMVPLRRLLAAAGPQSIQALRSSGSLAAPLCTVSTADVMAAIRATKPSVTREDALRFVEWERRFGAA
jgi:katanin p60 ATPase-containing subunit A1